jgi:cytochrome P450
MFDPQSTSFAQDPYSTYASLRALREPYFLSAVNAWLLSRFEEVDAAARHPQLVRSLDAFMSPNQIAVERRKMNWHDMPNHCRFVQTNLLESDGETHFRLRLVVLRELSRAFVERQRDVIQCYVDRLLDELLEREEIDFVGDLAAHVPGHVIGQLLGVPEEDCSQLRIWSENVVQFFDVGRNDTHKQLAESATTEFYQYLQVLINERTRRPKNDLISTFIQAMQAGEMDETELISTCMLILMAGHGSTIDVLGSGLLTLLQHPGELDQLKQQPALMPTAVQEMFRYESPLPFFHRYAAQDIEFLGRHYPKGSRIGLLYGAANRDPDRFPVADRFDITRSPNRHIAFGRGAHLCLGNHLSRLDMQVIFQTLLKRTREIELVETPSYRVGLSTRGLQTLKIKLVAA